MSYKAALQIGINYSLFKINDFHKEGSLHYRTSIYYIDPSSANRSKVHVKPSKFEYERLYFSEVIKEHNLTIVNTIKEPFISQDETQFVSRQFPVAFVNRKFAENTTAYWRHYVDVDKLEILEFYIEIELVFYPKKIPQGQNDKEFSPSKYFSAKESQVISNFKGKINKSYDVFTYVPVSFDDFQYIQLSLTYHAIVSEFTFVKEKQQPKPLPFFSFSSKELKPTFCTFKDYLDQLTENFLSSKIKIFFCYYRDFLLTTYQNLLKRKQHYEKIVSKGSSTVNTPRKSSQVNLEIEKTCQRFMKQYENMYRKYQNLEEFQVSKSILSDVILDELSHLTNKITTLWNQFSLFVKRFTYKIVEEDEKEYLNLIEQRYKNNIFSHKIKMKPGQDYTFSRYDDSGASHFEQARWENQKRVSQSDVWSGQFLIQNMSLIEKEQKNIKMFEERYMIEEKEMKLKRTKTQSLVRLNRYEVEFLSEDSSKKYDSQMHIIFLVHGFGASKVDMLLLKSFIQIKYSAKVIISMQNVGRTEESIQILGQRLAEEVKSNLIEVKHNFKLSFIGHSMGGLIIRSAIPRLQKFRVNFHSYISICTPHLGYLYEPPSLTKMGLWMLSQLQKCDSVTEVQMKDNNNLKRCYLYNLAMNESLKWFRNIAFVASNQDSYVPYESARVEKSGRLLDEMNEKEKLRASILKQMVDGMLKGLKQANEISRINVVFNIQETTISALIGRLGHVKFLSDDQFIKEFVICFKRFFQ